MINPTYYLIAYRENHGPWQAYRPAKTEILIGRAPECELRLQHNYISRHHVLLAFTAAGITLTDLGSSNGTRYIGQPLKPRHPISLAVGAVFTLGPFEFKLTLVGTVPTTKNANAVAPVVPFLPPSASTPATSEHTFVVTPQKR